MPGASAFFIEYYNVIRITAMNSRQQTILQMVIDQGQVSVTDLAKATGVSEVTIRRDLNTLENLAIYAVHMVLLFRLIAMMSKPV